MKINGDWLEEYSELISHIIRSERDKQGLKAKNLADRTVSEATLSNIVNRTVTVKEEKIFHVLEKLGISKEELTERIGSEHAEKEKVRYYLKLTEVLINSQKLDEAKKHIEYYKNHLPEFYPLYPFNQFLEGLYYLGKKEHILAEEILLNALETCKRFNLNPFDHFVPTCYSHLSKCKYQVNDIDAALLYLELGLGLLGASDEHYSIKWMLLGNKIVCLEKLGQYHQALQLTQKTWKFLDKIELIQVKLSLYKSKANLLIKSNQTDNALECANVGFHLAYNSPKNRYIFDFLMILGSIHLLQKDVVSAENSFRTVILIDDKIEFPRRQIEAYTYLSILYIYQKQWAKAKKSLHKAITIGRDVQDIHRLTRTLIVKGNYYYFQNLIDKAIPYYEEASILAKENNFDHRQYRALFKLTECHAMLENEESFTKYNKELFYLQKKIDLNQEDDIYEVD